MPPATNIIRGIRQSEKGARVSKYDQYIVEVARNASKNDIRNAVNQIFGVSVKKVNTVKGHGKWRRLRREWGRRPDIKKAIVTLEKDQKIEFKE